MGSSPPPGVVPGDVANRLLQQQLIDARDRLDRQASRLDRLNRLSDELLGHGERMPLASTFAEAIVDVLDQELGAVWLFDGKGALAEFGVTGPIELEEPPHDGAQALLGARVTRTTAQLLTPEELRGLLPAQLVAGAACRARNHSGSATALLLAGITPRGVGLYEPLSPDVLAALTALAEKCSAYLDYREARQLIEDQFHTLRESEERLALVFEGTSDGWWDWKIAEDRCHYSARWSAMLGGAAGTEGTGGFWADLVAPGDRPAFDLLLEDVLRGSGTSLATELRLRRADGQLLPVLVRGVVRRDGAGRAVRLAGSIQDLTERKRQEEDIHHLAFFDALTELPNRRQFEARVAHALAEREQSGQHVALLILDIDRFKTLNDTHGHAVGDSLLKAVAQRLRLEVRPEDCVARLGGDEYVMLLSDLGTDAGHAAAIAERVGNRVLDALNAPYTLEVGVIHHTASIGIALADGPGWTVGALLKDADVALYQAKAAGRNAVRMFQPEMQARVAQRSALEARLREGFDRGAFALHYQPQVDVDGRLAGAEALLRWFPPAGTPGGSPAEFVPVAEESGLIHKLGSWGLEQVCAQLRRWQGRLPEGFRVAFNVSAAEFLHPEFLPRVVGVLGASGVSGRHLRLELTEATVLTELTLAAQRIAALRSFGVEFSLDDFGTGFSSLSYLRHLPVSEVKIDRSYVGRMAHDPHDAAIVRSILALCETLGLRVVAEGVESEREWGLLRGQGCTFFQGYLFGAAVRAGADPAQLLDPVWLEHREEAAARAPSATRGS